MLGQGEKRGFMLRAVCSCAFLAAVDIFSEVYRTGHPFLRAAALRAAHELGLPAALGAGPVELATLARRLGAVEPKLRALVDVLAVEGFLRHEGGRIAAAEPFPPSPVGLPESSWGRLAQVLRTGSPLPGSDTAVSAEAAEQAYHHHLLDVGAKPARELAERWGAGARRVLDAGGGAGAYAAALLASSPDCHLTLVDRPAVLRLAAVRLAGAGGRLSLVADDLRTMRPEPIYDLVLLVHVLHLHGPEDAAAIVARCAAALAPGGRLLVKDLRVAPDRSGPAAALYFALNMALYTEAGDVWPPAQIEGWMRAARLVELEQAALRSSPETFVLLGSRRPSRSLRGAPPARRDDEVVVESRRGGATKPAGLDREPQQDDF